MNGVPRTRAARRRRIALLAAAVTCGCASLATHAQVTSVTGANIAFRSNSSATLGSQGYVGTYLTVPAGGATLNFTVNATAAAGATTAPHMNLVIADSVTGFTVNSTAATNYTTPNITLPAGTYFIRNERDYGGNVGVTRSFTVGSLAVNTVSGGAAGFSNFAENFTNNVANEATNNGLALAAANTYIDNFRKGSATVALNGPSNIPLLAGTPVQVDLARHAFNFGTEVPGNTPTEINNYLGSNGTTLQTNFQQRLNQNFNAIVPGNGGKWQNNEFTRDAVTMSGVDQVLNYAQSHNMRARMHGLIWGKNSFNGQQPSWVLNSSNTGLLDQANNTSLTAAQRETARADLRGEISERIGYYLNATRAAKMVEVDIYNESVHEPEYTTGLGYTTAAGSAVQGIGSIYAEAASTAPGVKTFTNEYNVFQNSYTPGNVYQPFNNWYLEEIAKIRDAGGTVGGVGAQYYPIASNPAVGSNANQHSAARMMAVWQNLATHGVSTALTEYGIQNNGEVAASPQILDESVRLTFGTPNATGFMMWGFWSGEGLFAGGSPFYDANWNITATGKKWQDLLGIQDWDGDPNNAWDTNVATTVNPDGTITFNGFFGDYYLRGQTSGAYDMTLAKGTNNYAATLAAPATWSMWNTSQSGNWGSAGSWLSGGVASSAGQTAYFGNGGLARTVTVDTPRTLGMLAFGSSAPYTIAGSEMLTLQGFNVAGGHRAAIYVAEGSHTINAPLALADDTTVTVAPAASTLTVSNLQVTPATVTKAGDGTLQVNNVRAAALNVVGGLVRVAANGSATGASNVGSLSIAPGAKLDLKDNKLITDTPAGSATGGVYTGVQRLVQRGHNGGGWDGDGIVTSLPDAGAGLTTIGVATGEQAKGIGPTETDTFAGQTITGASTIAMYTYAGDANLDGQITGDDYSSIDFAILTPGTSGWYNGDFNYDGIISGDDYSAIDFNLLAQGAPFSTSGTISSVSTVPEPTSVIATMAFVAATGARRRRSHRVVF